MSLIKEYFELTDKYQDDYGAHCILLMQVGSFFEVYGMIETKKNKIYGSKIEDFSRICELNIVQKNVCVGDNEIVMAGFKDIMIEKYIKKIQEAGFTAVVYTQDEAAKNTTRSLAGIFSPGTYFTNDTTYLSNNLICIWITLLDNILFMKGKFVVVGVSNIDIITGKTNIFQFKEEYIDNPTTFDDLERFVSIYNPSEVIFISNLSNKEVDNIISYAEIKCKLIHKINTSIATDAKQSQSMIRVKNCEKQTYQKEILNKFYNIEDFDVFVHNFNEYNIATQSFCFLLDFVYQHNPNLVNKIAEPVFDNCSDRLILANHSLKQLNIVDDENHGGKYSSVVKMLNECLTPMGKRKFSYNLLNPTTNKDFLQKEYDIVEYMLNKEADFLYSIKTQLLDIKDISKWERQIFLKKISPKAFYNLYNNLKSIEYIYTQICKDKKLMKYLTFFEKNIKEIGNYCEEIMKFINEQIDLGLCRDIESIQQFEVNFIVYGVDSDLDKKTEVLKESEMKLAIVQEYLSKLIENKAKKGKASQKTTEYVKIHETEKNNYSLVCTSRRCKILEDILPEKEESVLLNYDLSNKKKLYEFKISKKSFIFEKQNATNNSVNNQQISELCKNISSIKVSMKDYITLVFNKIVECFEVYKNKLESVINFVTYIDLIYTKVSIAKKYTLCKPQMEETDKSFVNVEDLRHCLIENLQTNENYVTNNLVLGNGKQDGILLYGTNAVGKTSFIRALGIAIIMAQAGLFVPASKFVYKPYKYIFTRILGNDNIFKGLSTFAVEMSELRTILRLANKDSLILGDELCSGTENISAISIFVAGIQMLCNCKSSFIFATHLHEIVNYGEITSLDTVVLKHMTVIYDKEKDMLIYDRKLKDGPGNRMYGLEVCKSLKLPQEFLDNAFNIRMKYHPEEGSILSLKSSHFNAKKIMGMCEKCGINMGKEVHHLEYQNEANKDGKIIKDGSVFHKNNLANLLTLCEKCHNEIHDDNIILKKVKTSKGYKLSRKSPDSL